MKELDFTSIEDARNEVLNTSVLPTSIAKHIEIRNNKIYLKKN